MKTKKLISPNKLPFLQAQILQQIYIDIYKNIKPTIQELAELTGYDNNSKTLLNAINSLVEKNFLIKNSEENLEFAVPEERYEFYNKIVNKYDYKHKKYNKILLEHANEVKQINLFDEDISPSNLNKNGVIHKWYNYLEEFPYSLIEEKINEYGLNNNSVVLDPFCGSGTTLVTSNLFNINAIGFDSNPLMTFVSKVKTTWDINLDDLTKEVNKVSDLYISQVVNIENIEFKNDFIKKMPKRELNQWLSPLLQKEVSLLKDIIEQIKNKKIRNLLLLSMAKSCFDASYVSLCPGTTFYPFREKDDLWDIFSSKTIMMYNDLKQVNNLKCFGKSRLINDTCLNASRYIEPNSIDFIITSPPYPNDLEYTRQTRLELYLLDFVNNMDDVQKIKKKMVKGSTKLIYKESDSEKYIHKFKNIMEISDNIYMQTKDKNWGFDYPRMIKEYFGDMYLCLKEMYKLMKNGAHFLLVVGDQTVKGVMIPVGAILLELAKDIGYKNCSKQIFRVRRSTAHNMPLNEEIVILEKRI